MYGFLDFIEYLNDALEDAIDFEMNDIKDNAKEHYEAREYPKELLRFRKNLKTLCDILNKNE